MPANADSGFVQDAPVLGNQWDEDLVLQSILKRLLPSNVLNEISPDLRRFGWRVVDDLKVLADRAEEDLPKVVQYDAWCRRVDELKTTEAWRKLHAVSAEEGLVAIPFERKYGSNSRIYQMAKLYLFGPSGGMYGCPLSMTDGAARVIELMGTPTMKETVYKRLTTRDPKSFWTSGQWMTERPGGSDVGQTETEAELIDPDRNLWSISGFKWFSSATDAGVTMLLARSRNPKTGETKPGSKGLSLYLARVRDDEGKLNGVRIHRLKNKFGTKAVPTAELELNGMIGELVGEIGRGVPTIASILNITRIHSAKECVAGMRRAYALAKAYAEKRKAFGKPLTEQPLHITTLAEMEITYRACMQLLFFAVQLLGRIENADANSDTTDQTALRLVTPMLKAWVAKTSVGFISESMEALGGQGYMEEVGIGRILRDTQVNTIWEGTTNILSLDIIRVLKETKGGAMGIFEKVVINAVSRTAPTPALASAAQNVRQALTRIKDHVATIMASGDKATMEAGARALTFAMARTLSGALLIEHAEWQQRQAGRGGDADLTADADMQAAVRWCDSVASLLGDLKVRNVSSILNDAALVFGLKARI